MRYNKQLKEDNTFSGTIEFVYNNQHISLPIIMCQTSNDSSLEWKFDTDITTEDIIVTDNQLLLINGIVVSYLIKDS